MESRIWPLPIRKLWGIGPKTENRLKGMGVETIGQLADVSLEALVGRFGQSYGNFLYHASKGSDERPVVTDWGPPKSLSRETTFENDIEDWPTISKAFAELSKDTVAIMKKRSLKCRTVTLKLRLDDFTTFSRSQTLDQFTDDLETIRKAVFQCFKRVDLKRKIRLIGVRLSNFTE